MDAAKVLGAMIAQRVNRGGGNGQVLSRVLEGIAAGSQHQDQHTDPRFAPERHEPLESLVRDSVVRHRHAGGQFPDPTNQWVDRHHPHGGRDPHHNSQHRLPHPQRPGMSRPPMFSQPPRHHPSGLGCDRRAEVLILAMIMAAQADGGVDESERDRMIDRMQPLDPNEVAFLRREFNRIHRFTDLTNAVPAGMEYEVYAVSLMTMDIDTHQEVEYLKAIAHNLRIDPRTCNQIHHRFGVRCIY